MRENFVPTPLSCAYINQLKSLNELFMKQNACKAHTQSHTHTYTQEGTYARHVCGEPQINCGRCRNQVG